MHAICVVDHNGHEMKTFLPPKAKSQLSGRARYETAVKLELGDAVWENPLIARGALAVFNGCASEHEFSVSANRSISRSGLKRFFIALACVCLAVSGVSYLQGNVLVPMFVTIDLAIICAAVLAVARASTATDTLSVDDAAGLLWVHSTGKRSSARQSFNIRWVRLQIGGPIDARRIYLTASGHSVEIGSFLNHEQRVSLANQLKSFLELAKARALN